MGDLVFDIREETGMVNNGMMEHSNTVNKFATPLTGSIKDFLTVLKLAYFQ